MNWIFLFLIIFSVWGFLIEPNWYRLRRISVPSSGKIQAPITILHLSDLHLHGKPNFFTKMFLQQISVLNPDLIVFTGDIIDNDGGIEPALKFVSGLRARYGIFMVPGNHEYYDYRFSDHIEYHLGKSHTSKHKNDTTRFLDGLRSLGVHILINQNIKVNVRGSDILIMGVNDPLTQEVDLKSTLNGISGKTFNLFLTHHLDILPELEGKGINLALAGHTHGGQIRLPVVGPILTGTKLPRHFAAGLNQYADFKLFVTHGLGAGRLSFPRMNCRPEAVWVEVTR